MTRQIASGGSSRCRVLPLPLPLSPLSLGGLTPRGPPSSSPWTNRRSAWRSRSTARSATNGRCRPRACGYRTPNGTYKPQRLARKWFSRKYDWSPMPYSIFFDGGYAIHGSYEISHLGRPASHGCVRLHPDNAALLFALVKDACRRHHHRGDRRAAGEGARARTRTRPSRIASIARIARVRPPPRRLSSARAIAGTIRPATAAFSPRPTAR